MSETDLSIKQIIIYLKHTKLFRYASDEDLKTLAESAEEVWFENEQIVFAQDEIGDSAYLIINGRVDIFIDEMLMAHYDRGQLFGELAVLDSSPYTATATCIGDCTLLKISEKVVFELMGSSDSMRRCILKSLIRRLKRHILV